jgi:hypothetical protein
MGAETIDYAAVLADLEAKRAAIDASIAGIRQMLNLEAEQGTSVGVATGERRDHALELRFDSFFRMSLPAAIVKFLGMAKRPQSVSEITRALLEGGFKTTSKNFMPIVGSNLSRLKTAGETVNVEGKWGLTSWYPAARAQGAISKKKASRAKSSAKAKRSASPKPKVINENPEPISAKMVERVKELKAAGKTNGEIAKELGVSNIEVWRALKPVENVA